MIICDVLKQENKSVRGGKNSAMIIDTVVVIDI